jgi:hypothetical protein
VSDLARRALEVAARLRQRDQGVGPSPEPPPEVPAPPRPAEQDTRRFSPDPSIPPRSSKDRNRGHRAWLLLHEIRQAGVEVRVGPDGTIEVTPGTAISDAKRDALTCLAPEVRRLWNQSPVVRRTCDARMSWPQEVPGLGLRQIGTLTPCVRCGQGTWAHYGKISYCLSHAKEAALEGRCLNSGVSPRHAALVLEVARIFTGVEVVEIRPRKRAPEGGETHAPTDMSSCAIGHSAAVRTDPKVRAARLDLALARRGPPSASSARTNASSARSRPDAGHGASSGAFATSITPTTTGGFAMSSQLSSAARRGSSDVARWRRHGGSAGPARSRATVC